MVIIGYSKLYKRAVILQLVLFTLFVFTTALKIML